MKQMEKIMCILDMSVPQNSQCAKCCIYCADKECECRCPNIIKWKSEDEILYNCVCAEEG